MKKTSVLKIFSIVLAMFLVVNSCAYAVSVYTLTDQISYTHTKREILQKMNEIKQYNYKNGEYLVTPVAKAPYVAGSLQQGVIDDTLRSVNFYRWMAGLNDVVLNSAKMERNQKGAVVLKRNNVLTHFPEQPSDMDDDFFNEAEAGCGAGYLVAGDFYSGNCAMDYSYMPDIINGYISDLNNMSTENGAVGHRVSLLTPNAYAVSFGKCGAYSTLSMYYTYSADEYRQNVGKDLEYEDFYAYPSAGYFPRKLFTPNECWSIFIAYRGDRTNLNIKYEYNGKEYDATDIRTEVDGSSVSFKMPSSLISAMGGSSYTMPKGEVKVKISNFHYSSDTDLNIEYTVNFFDETDVVQDFSFKTNSMSLKRGQSKKIELIYTPTGTTPEEVSYSTDSKIIKVDGDGNVKAYRPGSAKVLVNVDGLEKEYTVNVTGDSNYLLGDINKDGKVNADDAADAIEIFKTNRVTDEDLIRGDMDNNDAINAEDAALIIEYFKTHN